MAELTKQQQANWRVRTNEALASEYAMEVCPEWKVIADCLDTIDARDAEIEALHGRMKALAAQWTRNSKSSAIALRRETLMICRDELLAALNAPAGKGDSNG